MRWATLVLVFLMSVFVHAPAALAGAPPVPHENPAKAEGVFDSLSLLRYYGNAVGLLGDRNYGDVLGYLSKLKYASLPPELRSIAERYASLLGQVGNSLSSGETSLARASSWLAQGDKEKAQAELSQARRQLAQAQVLLENLRQATQALADRLGVFASPAGSPLRLAYGRLEDLLGRVRDLQVQLQEVLRLMETEGQAPDTLATQLQEVLRLIETGGQAPDTLATQLQEVLRLMETGGQSPAPALYVTRLELSLPNRGYPGRPVRVWGRLLPEGGAGWDSRRARVLLEDRAIGELVISGESFDDQVVIPADVSLGYHQLTVLVTSQGQYTAAAEKRPLEVVRATPVLEVRAPSIVFLWRDMAVSGLANSEFGPVQGATVVVEMAGASAQASTDAAGHFEASLSPSHSPILLGPRRLSVTLLPQEPWHAPVSQQISLVIVNPTQGGILALALFYLGAVVVAARRPKHGVREERATIAQLEEGAGPSSTERATPGPQAPKDRVLQAYSQAQKAVERVTGRVMTPSTTMRGYLRALGPSPYLSGFSELTGLAEIALYSRQAVGPDEVARAGELLSVVTGAM